MQSLEKRFKALNNNIPSSSVIAQGIPQNSDDLLNLFEEPYFTKFELAIGFIANSDKAQNTAKILWSTILFCKILFLWSSVEDSVQEIAKIIQWHKIVSNV